MDYCCEQMKKRAEHACEQHTDRFQCGDCIINYCEQHGFGIIVHDGGQSQIGIKFCPWCGTKLNEQFTAFKEWTCAFPGKMGLSWKRSWWGTGTKEQAEEEASKNCNVLALPLQLFEHIKETEARMVIAERCLNGIRVDAGNWEYRNRGDAGAKTAAAEGILDQALMEAEAWYKAKENLGL